MASTPAAAAAEGSRPSVAPATPRTFSSYRLPTGPATGSSGPEFDAIQLGSTGAASGLATLAGSPGLSRIGESDDERIFTSEASTGSSDVSAANAGSSSGGRGVKFGTASTCVKVSRVLLGITYLFGFALAVTVLYYLVSSEEEQQPEVRHVPVYGQHRCLRSSRACAALPASSVLAPFYLCITACYAH